MSFFVILVDSVHIVAGHNVITISQVGLGKLDTEVSARVAKAVMTNLDAG